jgi:hypothetical protein
MRDVDLVQDHEDADGCQGQAVCLKEGRDYAVRHPLPQARVLQRDPISDGQPFPRRFTVETDDDSLPPEVGPMVASPRPTSTSEGG